MEKSEWVAGVVQKLLADLLKPAILAVVTMVMVWMRSKEWRWVAPVLYGLVTALCLYFLLYGFVPWVLGILFVISLGLLVYVDVRSYRQPIVLVTEKSWLESAPGANYKLKLRVDWRNEGEALHIGKPRWIPEGIGVQGDALVSLFHLEGSGEETAEIDVRPGQGFHAWLGLNPAVDISEAERLKEARRLGVIALPVRSAGKDIELRIRP